MTLGQGVMIGPFNFNFIRMLLATGLIRIFLRQERIEGRLIRLDWVMIAWGGWSLCSSAFYADPVAALVYRLGVVYNHLGIYFLIRTFCRDGEDILLLAKITAFILAPLALEMISEQITGRNSFAIFGRVAEEVTVREGRLRAQGPFAHAILAGTVGAACLPLMIGIWRHYPAAAKIGFVACLMMAVASASSGPLVSILFSTFALVLWSWRHRMRVLQVAAIFAYGLLEVVMERPAYFIIQKFDLTGSSTGWHRAQLIRSTIEHLNEWWIAGTNYTRHWMPTGVPWSPDHTDITNHYIANGVQGGILLMAAFTYCIWVAFGYIGDIVRADQSVGTADTRFAWSLGACLFSHAASSLSVAYFDQSFVFLYLTFGAIASFYQATHREQEVLPVSDHALQASSLNVIPTVSGWATTKNNSRE